MSTDRSFEYRTTTAQSGEGFRELGKEGWELVSVVVNHYSNNCGQLDATNLTAYFKREIK